MCLSSKKIGLVLSGGGAKGAYQVGMMRALEELGIAAQITAISGCSIGAYNAACYSANGTAGMREMLTRFERAYLESKETPDSVLEAAKALVLAGEVSLADYIARPYYHRCNTQCVYQYLNDILPDDAVDRYTHDIYICAYSLQRERPIYFTLNDRTGAEQRALIIASGSLAFEFPPVSFEGDFYLDGGEIPEICTNKAKPSDKIPLLPLADLGLDAVITSFLIAEDTVDASIFPSSTKHFELRPSRPLEDRPGSGTLDFSPEKLASHEALGYQDTLMYFKTHSI